MVAQSTGTMVSTFERVGETLHALLGDDPTYSAQLAVHHRGELVVDLTVGTGLHDDSLLPIFSSGKGAIGVCIALLVDRGRLDLDQTVAHYWPEFAANGKATITVRQLLSHQAGLPSVDGGFSGDELLQHTELARRFAAQRPIWRPGAAFGYHSISIGLLADELIRRITGTTLGDFFRNEVANPHAVDVHVGAGPELDDRIATVDIPTDAELAEWAGRMHLPGAGSLGALDPPRLPMPAWFWVNEVAPRRVGPPAAGAIASARGLSRMYAAMHHDLGGGRLVSDDTIAQMWQMQVNGTDVVADLPMRYGIVFQLPCAPRLRFGSARAYGHDGLGGSLAFSDPLHDLSFGYVVKRIPLPGGVDKRAIELARVARECSAVQS